MSPASRVMNVRASGVSYAALFRQRAGVMSVRLFKLKGVPEDEAREVRARLDRHGIDYYETPAGIWGSSMPALWLRREEQLSHAQELLEQFHTERFNWAREDYARRKSGGEIPTLLEVILRDPVRFTLYVIIIALVLYLSISPFLSLGTS